MPWTDPPAELSPEDKIMETLDKLPRRDAAITLGIMAFGTMLYHCEKPDRDFFADTALSLLTGIKHVAELDLVKFIAEQLEKCPEEQIPVKSLTGLLNRMGYMLAEKADESLKQSQQLLQLLELTKEEKKNG